MAPPRRKTRGSFEKERTTEPRYSYRQHRKQPELPRRAQTRQPFDVPELVYRLLNADKHNQDRGRNRISRDRDRYRGKMRKYQNRREPSYDTSSLRESTESIGESEYTKSVVTSMENLSRVMDATNSSRATGSENSSVSNISVEPITLGSSIDNTRSLLKKKSLVQIINNYIRAGIEEGKRQAKKYIRKALSFGVKSGYLIPTDPQGQVIRVSPTLVESRRSDPESRRKRRRARKGEEDLPFVDRRERRRGTPPLITKKKTRREESPEPVVPRKRRRTSASKKPGTHLKLTYMNPKKMGATPGRPKKKQTGAKKNNVAGKKDTRVSQKLVAPTNKRENARKIVKETPSKHKNDTIEERGSRKSRATKSTYKNLKDKYGDRARQDRRDLTDDDEGSVKSSDNEPNERTVTERRKSASSQEDLLQDVDETPGNPAREVEEKLESPNDGRDKGVNENVD